MTPKFSTGDVVSLNSGGGTMVVVGYGDPSGGIVHCMWLNAALEQQHGNIPEKCLQRRSATPSNAPVVSAMD
jgi:uncharacterized protein YodC (DUF2158 family)